MIFTNTHFNCFIQSHNNFMKIKSVVTLPKDFIIKNKKSCNLRVYILIKIKTSFMQPGWVSLYFTVPIQTDWMLRQYHLQDHQLRAIF